MSSIAVKSPFYILGWSLLDKLRVADTHAILTMILSWQSSCVLISTLASLLLTVHVIICATCTSSDISFHTYMQNTMSLTILTHYTQNKSTNFFIMQYWRTLFYLPTCGKLSSSVSAVTEAELGDWLLLNLNFQRESAAVPSCNRQSLPGHGSSTHARPLSHSLPCPEADRGPWWQHVEEEPRQQCDCAHWSGSGGRSIRVLWDCWFKVTCLAWCIS